MKDEHIKKSNSLHKRISTGITIIGFIFIVGLAISDFIA